MKKKPAPNPNSSPDADPAAQPGAEPPVAPPPPSDPAPSPADSAEAKLATATAQLAELKDRYLRLAADFDNYRKRTGREQQEARSAAQFDTLLAMLNVFDHFRLAMEHAEQDAKPEVLHSGMKLILAEFERAFAELGVEIIDATGEPFDPQCHEASAREPHPTVPANHVLRQWRCGYRLGPRLLRPAAVVVSAGPPPVASPDQPPAATQPGP